jgi:hypothetical protein
MQLAMQLRRLELQKRARMADSKGGRMDGVEGEEEKSKKQGGASGKGKERSRTSGEKGEVVSAFIHLQRCCLLMPFQVGNSKKVTIREPSTKDTSKTQSRGRTSGKENKRASPSKPKTQTLEVSIDDIYDISSRY